MLLPTQKHGLQKEREDVGPGKWLLPGIPFNRWILLPFVVAIQYCNGSIFAWSVFNVPIDVWICGQNRNMTPLVFSVYIGAQGLAGALMGPYTERRGPSMSCLLGAILNLLGYFLAALALNLKQLWLLILGFGIFGGFGTGLCFLGPVAALQKWFPDRRGLASGFAVCGFGAGSTGTPFVEIFLIEALGLPWTFLALGGSYFAVTALGACVLRNPPPDFKTDITNCPNPTSGEYDCSEKGTKGNFPGTFKPKFSATQALLSKDFRLIYFMYMSSVLFELCSVATLSGLVTNIFGRSAAEAAMIVSITGGVNLIARIVISVLSDFVGRKLTFLMVFVVQLGLVVGFWCATTFGSYHAFLVFIWTLTACYSGSCGTLSAYLAELFGASNTGTTFGVIATAWSLAGILGGLIYSSVFDAVTNWRKSTVVDPFPYKMNLIWIGGVISLGLLLLLFVTPSEKDLMNKKRIGRAFRKLFWRERKHQNSYNMESITVDSPYNSTL